MRSYIFNFFLLFLISPSKITADPRSSCANSEYTDFIASIQTRETLQCVGVIVNKNTVLTTALCVTDHLNRLPNGACDCRQNITIIYNLRDANLLGLYCAKAIAVEKTFIHKYFKRYDKWAKYDVAMLKTKGDMVLSPSFKPPKFPSKRSVELSIDLCEKEAVLAGYWMNKNENHPQDAKLTCLSVTVANFSSCTTAANAPYVEKLSLMCTMDKILPASEVCKAYYGAPLFCTEKNGTKEVLHALLSHRHGLLSNDCPADSPLFYTRADDFLNFLRNPEEWSS